MVLFGQILLASGLITEQDLQAALEEQKRSPRLLGEILRERGLLSRSDLWEAWTAQLTLKMPQLGGLKAPTAVRRLAFGDLSEHYAATPISVSPTEMVILLNSKDDIPILDDLNILYEIENITVAVTSEEISQEVRRNYPRVKLAMCTKCGGSVAAGTSRVMITEEKRVLFICETCYKKTSRDTGIYE
ncbi:MAG: hypothetical protein N2234_02300 [Planctomycetota bacterium]|nr:hypothetical protein [Planctomycetota bacterium]